MFVMSFHHRVRGHFFHFFLAVYCEYCKIEIKGHEADVPKEIEDNHKEEEGGLKGLTQTLQTPQTFGKFLMHRHVGQARCK